MSERTERDAHAAVLRQNEPSWKTESRRAAYRERRRKRRDAEVWLLLAVLVLLMLSAWWVWLT